MRVTMALTVDGLLRALRGTAHALAEAVEAGYADDAGEETRPRGRNARPAERTMDGGQDDGRRD